jgi:FkbM family methyltransferase
MENFATNAPTNDAINHTRGMKVLIVSAFPPDPAPEANHALHISERLAKSGLTVHVLCKKGSIAATQQNIVVHPVIDEWTWAALPRLARYMTKCQPDVVLLIYLGWIYDQHAMITFLPTICRFILPGVPCVTQFEAVDGGASRRSWLARALRRVIAPRIDRKDEHSFYGSLLRDSARIIALSTPHRDLLADHYSGMKEKSVILPPPPLIRFCPDQPAMARKQARDAIGAAETDFVLINWGYIYPGKGVETLLQAFRIACGRESNMRLVFVGGFLEYPQKPGRVSCRDYFDMVQELPERLGIASKVTWTGHFNWDSDAGSQYLHAGDACVLPLDWGVTLNNSSLAAASTHGLPVIGTELPKGQDEALEHGRNIYLCRPRDPEMLAEAIQLISENADLRERLRAGIVELARDWHCWDTMTKRLVEVLESAVAADKRPQRTESRSSPLTYGAQSRGKRISSDMRPHGLPEVAGDHPHVWSQENTPDSADAPLLSLIVAVYNVKKYLSQCLDSLVNQTLTNIEIIVVNDASTDNSSLIINDYKSRYPNLRVVNCNCNGGLASVRNIGLRRARGKYVGFIDGDDWADIRMCELMYRRANDDNSDVLIANAKVFYEDRKTFGDFFDQHIRRELDPQLRRTPFSLKSDPRILLLEPVAWSKLYKRSFLQQHAIQFEEGMNSYEDICFHFSVLLKATRISLVDNTLIFYRQNRPGQISGRTDRRVFEVFAIFDKIHKNLAAWNASPDVWAMLVKLQFRQFGWLLDDRVQSHHKQEFMAEVAKQLQGIPESGFRNFARQASPHELAKLLCMRRHWLRAYQMVSNLQPLDRQRTLGALQWRLTSFARSFLNRLLNLVEFEKRIQTINNSLSEIKIKDSASPGEESLAEVRRIGDQVLLLSNPLYKSGVGEAVWRTENDYYLAQTALFREGDVIVDVGAHVGVFSIYLAKKYPFVRIYAIEPDPINYGCLLRNIELNGTRNVTAINRAVSGNGEDRTLYVDAWNSGWSTIDATATSDRFLLRPVQVGTVTLEQLFQTYEIRHCRLLKITAPGAVDESLKKFKRRGCVDLLCGEVDLEDCSRVKLEMASWRIARQHFWRTIDRRTKPTVLSWIHQAPRGIERIHKTSTWGCAVNLEEANILSSPNLFDERMKSGNGVA